MMSHIRAVALLPMLFVLPLLLLEAAADAQSSTSTTAMNISGTTVAGDNATGSSTTATSVPEGLQPRMASSNGTRCECILAIGLGCTRIKLMFVPYDGHELSSDESLDFSSDRWTLPSGQFVPRIVLEWRLESNPAKLVEQVDGIADAAVSVSLAVTDDNANITTVPATPQLPRKGRYVFDNVITANKGVSPLSVSQLRINFTTSWGPFAVSPTIRVYQRPAVVATALDILGAQLVMDDVLKTIIETPSRVVIDRPLPDFTIRVVDIAGSLVTLFDLSWITVTASYFGLASTPFAFDSASSAQLIKGVATFRGLTFGNSTIAQTAMTLTFTLPRANAIPLVLESKDFSVVVAPANNEYLQFGTADGSFLYPTTPSDSEHWDLIDSTVYQPRRAGLTMRVAVVGEPLPRIRIRSYDSSGAFDSSSTAQVFVRATAHGGARLKSTGTTGVLMQGIVGFDGLTFLPWGPDATGVVPSYQDVVLLFQSNGRSFVGSIVGRVLKTQVTIRVYKDFASAPPVVGARLVSNAKLSPLFWFDGQTRVLRNGAVYFPKTETMLSSAVDVIRNGIVNNKNFQSTQHSGPGGLYIELLDARGNRATNLNIPGCASTGSNPYCGGAYMSFVSTKPRTVVDDPGAMIVVGNATSIGQRIRKTSERIPLPIENGVIAIDHFQILSPTPDGLYTLRVTLPAAYLPPRSGGVGKMPAIALRVQLRPELPQRCFAARFSSDYFSALRQVGGGGAPGRGAAITAPSTFLINFRPVVVETVDSDLVRDETCQFTIISARSSTAQLGGTVSAVANNGRAVFPELSVASVGASSLNFIAQDPVSHHINGKIITTGTLITEPETLPVYGLEFDPNGHVRYEGHSSAITLGEFVPRIGVRVVDSAGAMSPPLPGAVRISVACDVDTIGSLCLLSGTLAHVITAPDGTVWFEDLVINGFVNGTANATRVSQLPPPMLTFWADTFGGVNNSKIAPVVIGARIQTGPLVVKPPGTQALAMYVDNTVVYPNFPASDPAYNVTYPYNRSNRNLVDYPGYVLIGQRVTGVTGLRTAQIRFNETTTIATTVYIRGPGNTRYLPPSDRLVVASTPSGLYNGSTATLQDDTARAAQFDRLGVGTQPYIDKEIVPIYFSHPAVDEPLAVGPFRNSLLLKDTSLQIVVVEVFADYVTFPYVRWSLHLAAIMNVDQDRILLARVQPAGGVVKLKDFTWLGVRVEFSFLPPTTQSSNKLPPATLTEMFLAIDDPCTGLDIRRKYALVNETGCDAFKLAQAVAAAKRCIETSPPWLRCSCHMPFFTSYQEYCGAADTFGAVCAQLTTCRSPVIAKSCARFRARVAQSYAVIFGVLFAVFTFLTLFGLWVNGVFDIKVKWRVGTSGERTEGESTTIKRRTNDPDFDEAL